MIIRKKVPPYEGSEPKDFVLLWVEEGLGTKGVPRVEPDTFEPTKKELIKLLKVKKPTKT